MNGSGEAPAPQIPEEVTAPLSQFPLTADLQFPEGLTVLAEIP